MRTFVIQNQIVAIILQLSLTVEQNLPEEWGKLLLPHIRWKTACCRCGRPHVIEGGRFHEVVCAGAEGCLPHGKES